VQALRLTLPQSVLLRGDEVIENACSCGAVLVRVVAFG